MYHTFYITYSTFLWVNAIFTHAIRDWMWDSLSLQLHHPAQSLVSNIVIDSFCRSLYPRGLDPFLWNRDPNDPTLRTCHVGGRAEREGSRRSSMESGCVPAVARSRGAPGVRGRSLASAAGRMTCCEGEEGGWRASRCGPASAESDWPGSLRR